MDDSVKNSIARSIQWTIARIAFFFLGYVVALFLAISFAVFGVSLRH